MKTMANLIVLIILMFFAAVVIINLLLSMYTLRKNNILNINEFFRDVMHKFIFTIATFFPLQQDKLCNFINTHFGKLIKHFVVIAICRYFSDSKPNWFNDNSYCIVIVLYFIELTLLLLTPVLTSLQNNYLVPISVKIASRIIYHTHLSDTTDNLMLNL